VSWWAAGAPPGAPPGEGLLTLASGRQVHVRIHARTARERLPRELPRDCGSGGRRQRADQRRRHRRPPHPPRKVVPGHTLEPRESQVLSLSLLFSRERASERACDQAARIACVRSLSLICAPVYFFCCKFDSLVSLSDRTTQRDAPNKQTMLMFGLIARILYVVGLIGSPKAIFLWLRHYIMFRRVII